MSDSDRRIWLYWHDGGRSPKPPFIEACLRSLFLSSGCEARLCGVEDAFELLPDLPDEFARLIPPHQSDVFRVGVLARYGGMYVDADTFVLKPLAPLFDLLSQYDYVGIDWRPLRLPPSQWLPIASTILGPSRPALPFLVNCYGKQLEILAVNGTALRRTGYDRSLFGRIRTKALEKLGRRYPIGWDDLLSDVIVPCFMQSPPRAKLFDGAASWCALVGGPGHEYGNLGHPLKRMSDIGGTLPDTEMLTVANSLLPRRVRWAGVEKLRKQDTVLARLLDSTATAERAGG